MIHVLQTRISFSLSFHLSNSNFTKLIKTHQHQIFETFNVTFLIPCLAALFNICLYIQPSIDCLWEVETSYTIKVRS